MVMNFYIFFFLEKGNGQYLLDIKFIDFQDQMVLFIKFGQVNKVDNVYFECCYLMFFEGDFLDEFFNDKDFIFKFGFFYNLELFFYFYLLVE